MVAGSATGSSTTPTTARCATIGASSNSSRDCGSHAPRRRRRGFHGFSHARLLESRERNFSLQRVGVTLKRPAPRESVRRRSVLQGLGACLVGGALGPAACAQFRQAENSTAPRAI